MMSSMDLVNAWRSLAKARIYVFSIVITLGITLGALITMFNLNYQLLAKPLPYPDQERLFLLAGNLLSDNKVDESNAYSYPSAIEAYKNNDGYFSEKALVLFDQDIVRSLPDTPQINISYVTPEYLQLASAPMGKGRIFSQAEGLDNHAPVALISYDTWVSLYEQDPQILDKSIRVGEVDFKIVGVTAKTFVEPQLMMPGRLTQVWLPWDFNQIPAGFRTDWGWFDGDRYLVGKLKPGAQPEHAAQTITAHLEQRFKMEMEGQAYWQRKNLSFQLKSFQQVILGDNKTRLLLILAGTLALVLIAATNILNLMLSRASSQQHAMAIRAAVGAQPLHLFRWVLAETLWVMAISLIVALVISLGLISLLKSAGQQHLPRMAELYLDWPSILLSILFSFILALGFAGLVMRQMNYRALNGILHASGKGVAIQVSPTLRRALLISQVMLSGLLLTLSVATLKESVQHIQQPTGMLSDNLVRIHLNQGTRSRDRISPEEKKSDYSAIYNALKNSPKVAAVSYASDIPFSNDVLPWLAYLSKNQNLQPQLQAHCFAVDENYLPLLGFRWIAGRNFTRVEMLSGAEVVIVNQTYARQWEADGEGYILGRRFFSTMEKRTLLMRLLVWSLISLLEMDLVCSPASQLLSAMHQYFNGWWDEFEPNVQNAEKIFSMLNSGAEFGFASNDFTHGESWSTLRNLARQTLDETGMELWPVPEKINFGDYIEIVDDFSAWRNVEKDT